jgi:heavy metal efflux system protein
MAIVIPITVLAIFLILCVMFRSYKWTMLVLVSVIMASIGSPFALFLTHTNFSVSSAVGFLELFGVSAQTGVIRLEYINQPRARGVGGESNREHIIEAAIEGAVLRLRQS